MEIKEEFSPDSNFSDVEMDFIYGSQLKTEPTTSSTNFTKVWKSDTQFISNKSRNASGSSTSNRKLSSSSSIPDECDSYKLKRARNNAAVQKSRAKARQRQTEIVHRVDSLRSRNDDLKQKISTRFRELNLLKSLMHRVGIKPPDELRRALATKQEFVDLDL